jgi:molecular chaperone DnaK
VSAALGVPPTEGLDPMTLVAQGAAIYAATAGLEARPTALEPLRGCKLWLQYPAMSSDLTPHVVGRLVDRAASGNAVAAEVRLTRADGLWDSPWIALDEEGAFVVAVSLLARRPNVFRVEGKNASGGAVVVDPPTLTIVQGLTISDPPLSRTIGVATAGDDVRVYFERGAPLPARRTFTLQTVETVAKGSKESLIKIPIVQGEYDAAHLCRLVGSLEISGAELRQNMPSGTELELTIELDRGGRMSARALVPTARAGVRARGPPAGPGGRAGGAGRADGGDPRAPGGAADGRVSARAAGGDRQARQGGGGQLVDLALDVGAAKGGDTDAAQKARRSLIELDALLESVELDRRWPELEKEAREAVVYATIVIHEHGWPHEQSLFTETARAVEKARQTRDPLELQRQLRLLNRLSYAAGSRDPEVWKRRFEHARSTSATRRIRRKAQALVKEGREALAKGDGEGLRRVVQKLWQLTPGDPEQRRLGYDSGVR